MPFPCTSVDTRNQRGNNRSLSGRLRAKRLGYVPDVTIPYVGRCLGSGKPPREGSEESQAGGTSGVCVACSGRFDVDNGTIVEHETAPEDERESMGDAHG